MIRPKNDTEDLLFSITNNCETLIEQTHAKAEETLKFKLTKPTETFSFNPTIPIEGSWMLGLTSLEVYNSTFNITEKNNKFELYTDTFEESSFEELKDEIEQILNISDITPYHLQHEKIGPRIIEAYKKLRSEKSSAVGYIIIILGYSLSPFREFEKHFTNVVGLDGDDIQLILKQYNSKFVTNGLSPAGYLTKDISDGVKKLDDHEGTLQI